MTYISIRDPDILDELKRKRRKVNKKIITCLLGSDWEYTHQDLVTAFAVLPSADDVIWNAARKLYDTGAEVTIAGVAKVSDYSYRTVQRVLERNPDWKKQLCIRRFPSGMEFARDLIPPSGGAKKPAGE